MSPDSPRTNAQNKTTPALRNIAAGGFVVTLTCLGALQAYNSADAATATLPIIAKLVRAIDITVNTSLNFGTMAMTLDRGGLAMIDPGLNRLVADGNTSLSPAGGIPQAGRLTIKGAGFPVAVSVEQSVVNLTNGITTVTVNNFNFMTAHGGPRVTVTPQAGVQTFTIPVGATLNTKPGQATGTYVGATRIYANFQ